MQKFSFPTENRQFRFEPKNPYDLVAERRVPRREDLTFPFWWNYTTLLEPFSNETPD